jgi:AcrR family transcriptional regulator
LARTLNPTAHSVRREAFVDVAQRLMQAKGYEEMSIQDVLDELDASRGAFYHYFDSKAALLAAVVDRMVVGATAEMARIVDDPSLSAVEKFEGIFEGLARYKGERTDLLMAVIRVWFGDENAIVREKLRREVAKSLVPLLSKIMAQGRIEGVFNVKDVDDGARVLMSLIQGANEVATELYFARLANTVTFDAVERTLDAYREAFERTLGLPEGTLTFVDRDVLRQWYG